MPTYAFDTAREEATSGVRAVLGEPVDVIVTVPPPSVDADLAVPCFPLAARLRKPPADVARQLAGHMPVLSLLAQPRADGGYLNFLLNRPAYANAVMEDVSRLEDRYGSGDEGNGKAVVIDFSSPNVARPMSVGHLRSTIIGDALYRLYAFSGYKPVGVNHYADWGTQFGTLLYGMTHWLDRDAYAQAPVPELLRLYVRFDQEAERTPSLRDEARGWAWPSTPGAARVRTSRTRRW